MVQAIQIPGVSITPAYKLADNFTLEEFFRTTHDNPKGEYIFSPKLWEEFRALPDTTRAQYFNSLLEVARRLQEIRNAVGAPVRITSGWRSNRLHLAIYADINRRRAQRGLAPVRVPTSSYHLTAQAADIDVAGLTPVQVRSRFSHLFGGIGRASTFTHFDIGPKRAPFDY